MSFLPIEGIELNSSSRKIAAVTGAGSGIGRASAIALSDEGYEVVLMGRKRTNLEETASLGSSSDLLHAMPVDVGDSVEVAELFSKIETMFGRLDLLFNNAGCGAPAVPMEELNAEQWQSVVNVNLSGAFYCTQQAIRIMKRQRPRGGRIINNGSVSAITPRPHSAPYTATKHAVTGLTKSTALDGREFDICCGQINIGNAGTEMTAQMKDGVLQPNGKVRPEPTMDVQQVAQAVVYMAGLPLDSNVLSMTVMANQMPFVGRG